MRMVIGSMVVHNFMGIIQGKYTISLPTFTKKRLYETERPETNLARVICIDVENEKKKDASGSRIRIRHVERPRSLRE